MRVTSSRTYLRFPSVTKLGFLGEAAEATFQEKMMYNFAADGHTWKASVIGIRDPHQRFFGLDDARMQSERARDFAYSNPPEDPGISMADLNDILISATTELESSFGRFDIARTKYRSEMKNDAASIAAGADKIGQEFRKAQTSLLALQATMNSEEMKSALANAERLATALSAINATESHKITFAVIDGGKQK